MNWPIFLDWMKNTLLFICSTNILVRLLTVNVKNCLIPKYPKMCDPILVTLLKMWPHYSQSSRENATPSSAISSLASYKEVPLPPGRSYSPYISCREPKARVFILSGLRLGKVLSFLEPGSGIWHLFLTTWIFIVSWEQRFRSDIYLLGGGGGVHILVQTVEGKFHILVYNRIEKITCILFSTAKGPWRRRKCATHSQQNWPKLE